MADATLTATLIEDATYWVSEDEKAGSQFFAVTLTLPLESFDAPLDGSEARQVVHDEFSERASRGDVITVTGTSFTTNATESVITATVEHAFDDRA